MEIELYLVGNQIYLIPAVKITYSKSLNGYYTIDLLWFKWGLSLMW